MISTFYWLIADELAGCSCPGGSGQGQRRGPPQGALDRDLAWLRGQGIGAVLSLTETPLAADALARHGLAALHLPVPDLEAPTPDQFMRALSFIDRQRARGQAVVVHCLVGQGRTATVLAAYRIRGGAEVEAALHEVRLLCPGAVGSPDQERAIHGFAGRRDWIL